MVELGAYDATQQWLDNLRLARSHLTGKFRQLQGVIRAGWRLPAFPPRDTRLGNPGSSGNLHLAESRAAQALDEVGGGIHLGESIRKRIERQYPTELFISA